MATQTPFLRRLAQVCRRAWRALTGADLKRPMWQEFTSFFGADYARLETHEKHYPGYDVASVSRALASFYAECCPSARAIGSCPLLTMRALLDAFKNPHWQRHKADAPAYQRVPVDVDEEISVVSNCLHLCVMGPTASAARARRSAAVRPEAPAPSEPLPDEKLAVLLTVNASHDAWDGMDTNRVPHMRVTISIACRSREAADRFFAEIEERRKQLNVFRGKVIDPQLSGGMVYAIGFRAIKQVRAEDLVLPAEVKELLHHAIVGFYNHRELLEDLGIEMKRGILLHGPPGTGKTSISLHLAGQLPGFTICFVSGDRLLYPREVCRMARYLQPAMVVFEDIDLIALQRDANGLATVLGELMNQIDGCEPTDQVLFLMNTNSLDRLESAVRNRPGRVDQIIEVPLPDREARRQLLATFARRVRLQAGDMDRILDATRDTSPAMLKEIVKRAVVTAVSRNGTAGHEVVLREDDLLLAAQQVQAMRDPIAVPGSLGFRVREASDTASRAP